MSWTISFSMPTCVGIKNQQISNTNFGGLFYCRRLSFIVIVICKGFCLSFFFFSLRARTGTFFMTSCRTIKTIPLWVTAREVFIPNFVFLWVGVFDWIRWLQFITSSASHFHLFAKPAVFGTWEWIIPIRENDQTANQFGCKGISG